MLFQIEINQIEKNSVEVCTASTLVKMVSSHLVYFQFRLLPISFTHISSTHVFFVKTSF